MKIAGVIGWPIAHSRSPAIHGAAYKAVGLDAIYLPLAVAPERLAQAIVGVRALGFMGVNVTVPHKQAVVHLCDVLDPAAAAVGAVNTVIVGADGKLHGHDTDIEGFAESLGHFADSLADRRRIFGNLRDARYPQGVRAVVLGSGGGARAVVAALRGMRIHTAVSARDLGRAEHLVELGAAAIIPWRRDALVGALAGIDLLVDATSMGLTPEGEAAATAEIPIDVLPDHAIVSSLVYHRDTALLAAARARGLATLDGSEMLIRQAAVAFRLMTGIEPPLDVMRSTLHAAGAK
jgi:shikimate dehydrogenase